jgi:hypothetical protein
MNNDLHSSITRLQKAARRMSQRWAETKEAWDDPVSREFEEKVVWSILPQVKLSIAAIHEMSEILDGARRECEDRFE